MHDVTAQAVRIAESSARERLFAQLLTAFGVFALLLAAIGLHGVVSYSVSRRTHEIGLRVAVGARPRQVQWLMLRQVLELCGAGLAIGIPVALVAGPTVQSLVYGVSAADPRTFVAAAAVLLGVALVAGYGPARRASRQDPLVALRSE